MMMARPVPDLADPAPLIVAIATTGRAPVLRETLRHLATLPDRPDLVVLSVADPADHDGDTAALPFPLTVIEAPRGLCAQRNAVLDALGGSGVLVFLDDDFLPAPGFMAATRAVFAAEPDVVMATGRVLADGILGPGLDHAEGLQLLAAADDTAATPEEVYNGYGCNMAVRLGAVARTGLRFDTALPRYGWLEDVDFSRRLAAEGRIVKAPAMQGVHLGTKTGRSRGVPLGYSQIANPVYLMRKRTMAPRRALRMMLRNCLANLARAPRPEPWVDRRGRLKGNLLGLRDLLLGRIAPGRIDRL